MKKWLSLVAIVVLGLVLVIGAACGEGGEEEEEGVTELKYGIGLPLVGAYGAAVGLPTKYAFQLAAEKIGEFTVAGKQYRWKLIFEDNLGTAGGGYSAANKFVYDYNVDFMHQSLKDPGMASLEICEAKGLLLGISACNFDDFSPDRPYIFQTSATWSLHAPAFFDWFTKEYPEVQRVSVVAPDDNTGYSIGAAVRASAEHFGLQIVSEDYTPVEMVEMMPLANKIIGKNPDLFVGAMAASLGDIYGIMVAMDYEGPAVYYYWTELGAERNGWDVCQGCLIFLPHPIGGIWDEVTAFREEYEDRYSIELTPCAIWACTVIYVLTDALEQAGTVDDIDRIIETMETATFDTLFGPLYYGGEEFNDIGHVAIYPTPIYKVIGEQEYELLYMYSPEETEALAIEVFK